MRVYADQPLDQPMSPNQTRLQDQFSILSAFNFDPED